jgi:hypothetical protein
LGVAPLPIPDFRQVLAVLFDVFYVLDELALHNLLQLDQGIGQRQRGGCSFHERVVCWSLVDPFNLLVDGS